MHLLFVDSIHKALISNLAFFSEFTLSPIDALLLATKFAS